jgi:hypothetical protein
MVGEVAENPGTPYGDRMMNEKNTMTKTEEELALHEVATSELQAIGGGYDPNNPPGCGFHPPGWHPPPLGQVARGVAHE